MNKITIQLRQHTPLIHFQHDQTGATLRATEVKPKLDRFILIQLGGGNYQTGLEKAKKNKWLIGDTTALDYKLRFFISEEPVISEINDVKTDRNTGIERTKQRKEDGRIIKDLNSYPLYFGNLDKDIDDNSEYKRFSFLNESFAMELFTFTQSLKDYIETKIELTSFFVQNNFGSRQSKGFGSFYIDKSDKRYKNPVAKYFFTIDVSRKSNWLDLFNTLDLFYKSLRSGINLKNRDKTTLFYFKSLLFLYFKSKNIQWDKKSIKERFFNSQLKQQITDHHNSDILTFSSPEQRLIKDLLGLSTNESWRSYSATVTKTNNNIDRFKSPITFKPLRISDSQFKVYLCFESINLDFLNKSFNIEVGNRGTLPLLTPADFSVDVFFQWILKVENFDIQNHVASSFHNHNNFRILDKIYQQLRKNQNSNTNVR